MRFYRRLPSTQACLALMLLISVFASSSQAEIFKFTDSEGKVHYVDSKQKIPAEYQEQLSSQKSLPPISKVSPGRERLYEKERYAVSGVGGSTVELFVTDWCGYCRKLEAFLDKENIRYKKLNIEKDKAAKKIHASLGSGVPITRIGKKVFQGYQPEAILAAARKK